MKLRIFLYGCILGALFLGSCKEEKIQQDYTQYVNPFVGTGGHGHTFPGATLPHGMIQPSPDTRIDGWDACSGYHYSDSTINGFSHTHLSGTGCCDLGDVLIMPTVGNQTYTSKTNQTMSYASKFSHDNEKATPGYYSVFLDRYKVKAELTATARGALHRYTFPNSNQSGFIIDLDYSLQHQTNSNMQLRVLSDTEICGRKKTTYWAFDQWIYFYAKFSKPFSYTLINDSIDCYAEGKLKQACKALLHFKTNKDEQIFVKVGISAVDEEGAKKNVLTEIPHWNFDTVRLAAKQHWNKELSKIEVTTKSLKDKQTFYSALYHTFIAPNLFMDIDGRYHGMDMKIHQGNLNQPLYTTFSLWDTFRALHPLMTIVNPDLNIKFVNSLIQKSQEGGILPMWDLRSNYTGCMIGYHAVPVIVDAYMKGYRDFDIEEAFKACLRTSTYDKEGIVCPPQVLPQIMPKAKQYKNELGYIPCDRVNESVARALAYAYDDWCISTFAKARGEMDIYKKYLRSSKAYEFYFDSKTRFMRGLDSNGEWREPFNPRASTHRSDDYCEGTAWQWTWFVPHDVEGLIDLMGGSSAFEQKLDSLFIADSKIEGHTTSSDISGLIGQYAHGNEPSHHISHLYNYVDCSYKTQALVDSILYSQYAPTPEGLSGNEDCGQMSAWYVLNAMGFYQVCPGKPIYSIARPIFDKAIIRLKNGKTFTIETASNSRENKYIKEIYLNNKQRKTPFFTHEELTQGGQLKLIMTSTPTMK